MTFNKFSSDIIKIHFNATKSSGDVSALLLKPPSAKWILVFAHGAGAGMNHRFMEKCAFMLAEHKIATFRFQFPYMEGDKKFPNPQPILIKTVTSAVNAASKPAPNLIIIAGGKSLGGRMTSMAAAKETLPGVKALVFFGFPLHAPGKPSTERGEHLKHIDLPMLFLQGTRDNFAKLELLKPLCKKLGNRTRLHLIEGGDHSFRVLKRYNKTEDETLRELASTLHNWLDMEEMGM